jgi:PNKP adenylyltransferase domain, ligase domain
MLDIKIKNRIDWFCKNQINDFSPTISPAPKNKERNEIESIYEAVHYFLKNGVNELVVQKKYMGSYCTIYLKRNLEESYFVSRNGHKIEHIDLDEAKENISELHQKMVEKYPDFETIMIGSELLPWKILGSGLIEKEFYGYYDAQKTHNQYLKDNNLYEKLENVKTSIAYKTFQEDCDNLNSKEFRLKHKSHVIRQYEALSKIKILDLNQQKKSLEIYKTQIDTFGKEEKIHFKPFNILKIVSFDGNETIPNSNLTYEFLNEDAFLFLKFNSENEVENIQKIYDFYENLTSNSEEGIMIKPEKSYVQGLVPCFKVRNNNYLTMIYGVNFHLDFDNYLYKRKIGQKMEQSINGWEINQKMLQIPYKNIDEENYLIKLLLLKRINDEEIEKSLDPTL